MAFPLPQPIAGKLISINEGVALLGPTGHPVKHRQLADLLTREEEARGQQITVKIRGRVYAPSDDIFKIHRDWVARTSK